MTINLIDTDLHGCDLEGPNGYGVIKILLADYNTYNDKKSDSAIAIRNTIYKMICELVRYNFGVTPSQRSGLVFSENYSRVKFVDDKYSINF